MLLRLRLWFIVALNIVLVCISLIGAWLLRFEFTLPYRRVLIAALPLLVVIRLAAMVRFNLLHGYWRHTGISDIESIVKSTTVGSVGFLVAERWVLGIKAFPITIYCLEPILIMAALCGVRLFSRTLVQAISESGRGHSQKSVLIVGAGDAAAMLLRGLSYKEYRAVGLVDDDSAKRGARIHGIPVLGRVDDLPGVIRKFAVDEVLIAIPSATGRQMRRITEVCERAGVRFRTIPGMADLINGTASVEQLRDVNIEDLLGRESIRLDLEVVRQQLIDKVVLVTGAAGSIGSELCNQLLQYKPRRLLCVDQDESALFFLEKRLSHSTMQVQLEYCVADVADRHRMTNIIADGEVNCIFHAAAYKHVPMMEANTSEAVRNNICGLLALIGVAEQCGCSDFLMISSDKAVNPTNVMGCTKRVCELIMAAKPGSRMRRLSVRFGNVLGSQGSVIPVLQEQIRKERVVTVTHPDITRFFMTIPEAVSLVLQAFAVGKHGEILVLDMGQPMRIVDLARTLIRLCGKTEDEIDIVYTGLRKGEKLHEELFYATESATLTDCSKVMRSSGALISWSVLQEYLHDLDRLVYSGTDAMIRHKLKQIVPEYVYVVETPELEGRALMGLDRREPTLRFAAGAAGAND